MPPRTIELLAPARNADIAIAAIDHGADAVYIGPPSHGARKMASNTLDDIARVVDYAHMFGARVYVTVNTIVYDEELSAVERLVWNLYRIGVDALIVQDMSLLSMHLPPIALHASTQCDIRTPQKAHFLQEAGFSQLVLPREFNLQEIAAVRAAVDVPLEVFVHGALCVSYSGDCQASFLATGRSANRGECAQICRYAFNLEDENGHTLMRNKHLLSLKDMNRIGMLTDLLEAGACSFKIEGRLKDITYVKNVVAAYNEALNRIIVANPERWRRLSRGNVTYQFTPNLNKSFNRHYTEYQFSAPKSDEKLATFDSPKWTGEQIGVVRACLSDRIIEADVTAELNNGDGLGFFNRHGEFIGFRLNWVDGKRLHLASDMKITPGTQLYRNNDKTWNERLKAIDTARRTIPVSMILHYVPNGLLVLDITDADGIQVSVASHLEYNEAKSDQTANRKRVLSKLGDTPFIATDIIEKCGNLFVPASTLTALRRRATDVLLQTYRNTHPYHRRNLVNEYIIPQLPKGMHISRHDNIANRYAELFYAKAANMQPPFKSLPHAIEITHSVDDKNGEIRVMQTRYCLRNELGACLRTTNASRLPKKLYLTSGQLRFRLDFDCANCRMNVVKLC